MLQLHNGGADFAANLVSLSVSLEKLYSEIWAPSRGVVVGGVMWDFPRFRDPDIDPK